MKYIGIDLGSSFIKAVLLDLDHGAIAASSSYPSPQKEPNKNPNIFQLSAVRLAEIVKQLIDEYTSDYHDVEGIIISTQMHGFVYTYPGQEDRYISWQDMRCMDPIPGENRTYLQKLDQEIPPEAMRSHGVAIKPSLAACNLYTLFAENPEIPRDGQLYTLGSYIIHCLTGRNICHISNAAPMGLADVEHHCWDQAMIRRLGLEQVKLPCLTEHDYEICGTYTSNGCVLKVHPDYGDMQVSILGSQIGKGDVVANVATGAQVIRYSTEFVPGCYEIRPFLDGAYLYTISNMPAGRNLDVLVRFLCDTVQKLTGIELDAQQVWEYIHHHSASDKELVVEANFYKNPYFPKGGNIYNITHSNLTIETLFSAAIDNMAATYWHFIQELCDHADQVEHIICAGGVCWKNPELVQALEKASGKPCRLSPMANEALAGMYRLSLVCSGRCENLAQTTQYPLQMEAD